MTNQSIKSKDSAANQDDEQTKSGGGWPWLALILVIGFVGALIGASYNPYLGAFIMLLFLVVGHWAAPKKWRRVYRLAIIGSTIGIFLGTAFWDRGIAVTVEDMVFGAKVAAFLVTFGLSFIIGFAMVALPVIGGAFYSAPWLEKIGGDVELSRIQLRKHLLRCYLETNPPYAIVGNGTILAQKPAGVMQTTAGPGIIIIRPETAVVLEWMGKVSQIKGPGKANTKMFERIKEVIDLRPQWGNTNEFAATTAEGETTTVQADFRYQIEQEPPQHETSRTGNGEHSPQPYINSALKADYCAEDLDAHLCNAIHKAVYHAGQSGWRQATERTVRNAIADAVRQHKVFDLFSSTWLQDTGRDYRTDQPAINTTTAKQIAQDAVDQACEVSRTWGVRVLEISIQHFGAPSLVLSSTRVGVESRMTAQRLRVIGQAEAEFARVQDSLNVETQSVLINNLTALSSGVLGELTPEERARLFAMIEKIGSQMGKDRVSALRFIEVLETISQNPNSHLIVTTGDGPISFENRTA